MSELLATAASAGWELTSFDCDKEVLKKKYVTIRFYGDVFLKDCDLSTQILADQKRCISIADYLLRLWIAHFECNLSIISTIGPLSTVLVQTLTPFILESNCVKILDGGDVYIYLSVLHPQCTVDHLIGISSSMAASCNNTSFPPPNALTEFINSFMNFVRLQRCHLNHHWQVVEDQQYLRAQVMDSGAVSVSCALYSFLGLFIDPSMPYKIET